MAQFTKLNLNAKSGSNSHADKCTRSTSMQKTLMFAGLLTLAIASGAALLAFNGCSKKENTKPAVVSSNQTSTQPSISPPSPSTPVLAGDRASKRLVQKPRKAPTVRYVNRTYGLSLQYMRKYVLKTGDDAQLKWADLAPVQMNFIQPGGVTLAALELPRSMYPGTDLALAFTTISVNRNLTSAQCAQFAFPKPSGPPLGEASPAKVKLGETEFNVVEQIDGDPMRQSDAKYYHVYENNTCYEFALGLGTSIDGAENETKPVDREEIFGKLEKILASVKIQSTPTSLAPGVTASQQLTPKEHTDPLMGPIPPSQLPHRTESSNRTEKE